VTESQDEAYEAVLEYVGRILDLEKTNFLLQWDSDVMMPDGGAPARSSQRTSVAAARRRYLTDDALGAALAELEGADLEADRAAVVREVRREYETATAVPDDLGDEISRVTSEAYEHWKRARKADDWSLFAPAVEEHIDLKRQWADCVDPDSNPYDVLWSRRTGYLAQPHIPLEAVDRIFDDLRDALITLIEEVRASDANLATDALHGRVDVETQQEINRTVLDALGIDWERTRFDVAPHPFSFGTQFDVRLATRYDETDFTQGMTATVHEFGHTAYTHGLLQDRYGTPLGEPRGIAVHESQSRFFENHVSRSEAFWEHFLPIIRKNVTQFEGVSPREAYECVNRVFEDNVIRVHADELTYHLHVVLRTEIERDLVTGKSSVKDVPGVWNDKMNDYLGIRPETDNEGCLQDPHWSQSVPGFIGYTIGSVLAAQLDAAMRRDLQVDTLVRKGEFEPIRQWLTDRVHRHGQRYRTDELIRRATGEDLTADYFVDYIRKKYGELYDL